MNGDQMTKKRKDVPWPTLTIQCPEAIERDLLLYWDDNLKPQKGVWEHPKDKKAHKKYRAAIKTLLEYFE
jgi:hypothetical protein